MSESREVRNKRIAIEAIDLAYCLAYFWGNAEAIREVDEFRRRWADRDVPWVLPPSARLNLDDWLTANEIAELADVTPTTVRSWNYRGHIDVVLGDCGRPLYNVGAVLRYQARRTSNDKR